MLSFQLSLVLDLTPLRLALIPATPDLGLDNSDLDYNPTVHCVLLSLYLKPLTATSGR